jgi:hypothetical protein
MRIILVVLGFVFALPLAQADVANITNSESIAGLKEALEKSSAAAIAQLGTANGFLGNPQVKIPLPGALKTAESGLRMMGMGKQADELVVAMNRAAESAVIEAKPLFMNAIKNMSFQDARAIVTGGDDAATQYFKRTTSEQLTAKFLPIVKQATAKVDLAEKYNAVAGQASKFGVLDAKSANVEGYVTQKTLDGLFLVMAEQEKSIRKDPIGTGSALLKRVFGGR